MSKYEYKTNYENQPEEWARDQEAWSKTFNQRLEGLEDVAGPSNPLPVIKDEQPEYWGPNTLKEWALDGHDSSGLQNLTGEHHSELPSDPGGTSDVDEPFNFWQSENQEMIKSVEIPCQQQELGNKHSELSPNDTGGSQYQEILNSEVGNQQGKLENQHLELPNDTGGSQTQQELLDFWKSQNNETIKYEGIQQEPQNLGESSRQGLQTLQNNQPEGLAQKSFDEGQQKESTDQSELNEPWSGDLSSPVPRHTTPESDEYASTVSDSHCSPQPIDLEKYLPHLGPPDANLTPEELEAKLQFQQDVLTMHQYNQRLAEKKAKEKAGMKSKDKGKGKEQIDSVVYDPAIHKFDPSTIYARPSNTKKRSYYEISDDDEEPGQQLRQSHRVGEKQEPWKQQADDITFEEFRALYMNLDPNVAYTLREGEQEPRSKRTRMSNGGRPVRPPKEDDRWNIWTVGDPNLKLRGSNISADYLRTVLYEDAGATGERRTKWSLTKLCERLIQRREYREKEAYRMGIRPFGKPKNWSPELPWWNYFDV